MPRQLFDKLTAVASPTEKQNLQVAYMGQVQAMKNFGETATTNTLNSMTAAQAHYQDVTSALLLKYFQNESPGHGLADWKTFTDTRNKAEVFRFLQDTGWQISERTFYRHVSDGKLKKNREGWFTASAVKKYAETWSVRPSGKTVVEEVEDLAAMKTRAEIERINTTQKREQFRLDVEKGKYLPRDTIEMELAGRAVALEAGFDHLIYTRSAEWIALVGGKQNQADLLIAAMMAAKDEWLNSYANAEEFLVTVMGQMA